MPIKELPIINHYDVQRFKQFSPMSCSNWYQVDAPSGKKGRALYPAMGRKHFSDDFGNPEFVFDNQPRKLFRSVSYVYVVVESTIYQIDINFNIRPISDSTFTKSAGDLNFAYLATTQVSGSTTFATFCMWCDGSNIFVYDEATDAFSKVTDTNRPPAPLYVAAFGNRFVVSSRGSTQFQLTQFNLGSPYNASTVFTINGQAIFAQASGLIQQMCVLHQQLYIFRDYTTDVWSNTVSVFNTTTFPFKKNTSYDFDYGIADPDSLDVDFGMITWLAQNRNGLVTFMSSNGQSPQSISTQAVNVLIQEIANASQATATSVLSLDVEGFLYQYEDTVFYRVSVGTYNDSQTLDDATLADCLEYNFNTQTWSRCIELNGQRNIIQQHVFFSNVHMVTAQGQNCLYQMGGNIYFNEVQDPNNTITGFTAYPFRYENITPIISEPDYSEFITDYIQIDFVWGNQTPSYSSNPVFDNTVFIVSEGSTDTAPIYVVTEDGLNFVIQDGTNTPGLLDNVYNQLFNPHVELYWSDDGGSTFNATSMDVLQFSQLGQYQWRMRWYQGGPSRNRVYKLVAVSAAPIVILGGVMNVRRASGGAN